MMKDNQPTWRIKAPLDVEAKKRLKTANRFGLWALVEKFQNLISSLQDRLQKASKIVTELEQLRKEMTPAQQVKFDQVKGQIDLDNPTF
jgi:hypothetical protein